jgi:hypothetical protein
MTPATPQEIRRLLIRQKIAEAVASKLATSMLSKVPPVQAHLLAPEDRHLAGRAALRKIKADARLKMLPGFLRKRFPKWSSILKLKLLALSLKGCSWSYWFRRRTELRKAGIRFSLKNSRSTSRAASPTRPSSPTVSGNSSEGWPFVSGENISGTSTSFPMKPSRESMRFSTYSEMWRALARRGKSRPS